MSNSGELKSAYELAMERLRRKDAEEGVERREITAEQRAAIAEVRTYYESKLAEQEVLHQSALKKTWDPVAREQLEEEYRKDRERLVAERDQKIERIRSGEGD